MNIVDILKNVPIGTKLYSAAHGYMSLKKIDLGDNKYPIVVHNDSFGVEGFTEDGRYYDIPDAECILFPSKEQRDWTEFKVDLPKGTPVVVFNSIDRPFDSFIRMYAGNGKYKMLGKGYNTLPYIVPFNKIRIEKNHFVFDAKDNYGSVL